MYVPYTIGKGQVDQPYTSYRTQSPRNHYHLDLDLELGVIRLTRPAKGMMSCQE